MKKIVSLCLCFSLLLALPACGGQTPRAEAGGIHGQENYPTDFLLLEGESIAFDEFRYYYLNYRDMYLEEDKAYFESEENEKKLRDEIVSLLRDSQAVRLLARENGVKLTRAEKKAVLEDLEKSASLYESEEAFLASLDQSYMTRDLWVYLMEYSALYLKLFNKLYGEGGKWAFSDEEFYDYFEEHYLAVQQIFLPFEEGENQTSHEKTAQKADTVYQRAAGGEDFWALVKECGKDENMLDYPDGYYFTEGQAESALYEASKALSIGEISAPVAGETGLYIIKRLEPKALRMDENRQTALFGYTDSYDEFHPGAYDEDFQRRFRKKAQGLKVETGALWEKITAESVY